MLETSFVRRLKREGAHHLLPFRNEALCQFSLSCQEI